jgi:hypothetical protein
MNWRDLFFLILGLFIGVVIQVIRYERKKIKPMANVFLLPQNSDRQPISFLGFKGETDPDPKAKRIYPPPHSGGANTSDVYDWGAQWIRERKGNQKDIPKAWAELPNVFSDYISKEILMANKQRDRFRVAVSRRLKGQVKKRNKKRS